jgi:FkbM family methyltransferase
METEVLKKIREIRGIIQVGANTGQESSLFRKYTSNVMCFEPIKDVFISLTKNNPDFICYNFALGERNEIKNMNIASNNGESSSFLKPLNHLTQFTSIQFTHTESVEIKRFDSLGIDINNFNVLISDTQGYEIQVLKGFGDFLKKLDYIYVEYINSELYEDCSSLDKIQDYLKQYSFNLDSIYPENSNWGNVLFINNNKQLKN